MDVESDGSERWEDFFGSSTDIGPSVLGYLDTLANNFNEEAKQLVESTHSKPLRLQSTTSAGVPLNRVAHVFKLQHEAPDLTFDGSDPLQLDGGPTREPASPNADPLPGRVRNFPDKFFGLVSPSVQRMVSHTAERADGSSGVISTAGDERTFMRSHVQSASFSAVGRRPSRQTTTSPPLTTGHTNLPLSKNIAKLRHVNGDLIDHFMDKPAPTRRPRHRPTQQERRGEAITSAMDVPKEAVGDCNSNLTAVEKRREPLTEELQNVTSLQRQIRSLTVDLENSSAASNACTEADTVEGCVVLRKESTDDAVEDAFVENCVELADHRNTVVEACNPYLSLGRCVKIDRPNDPAGSDDRRTLADARAKLLDGNGNRKISVPDSPKLSLRIDADNSTSTSTPSLNTTYSSSPYSSKMSLLIPPNTPQLSSRPLSASSICSYSSSTSSSGSENRLSGCKGSAPGSYQASVESLADHSESEQMVGGVLRHVEGAAGIAVAFAAGMTMCERAVREIIDSESSYVKDLGQVIRGYLEDWKERACLKHDQLKVLFSNIQEIYDFNFKLLNRLREAKGNPVDISNCFIDLHAEFSCYTTYCTSYPEAISLLTTLLQATHTNALLVSTQKMLKHTLPLGSYLLKPVQRILKYHLLLDNLRKHCDDKQVALAHDKMKKVAHNIDQVKTKLDQARLVKELAGILDGWLGPDLSVLGDLLQEGRLMEHAKPRVVLLFQTMIIVAKPKEDKRLQFRSYIPCKNLMLVEHLPGEQTSFNVIPFDDPKGVLKLTARNREEKKLWTQQIKQAMLKYYSDIPQRAMDLVLQLGDEDERFTDKPYWKRPTNNSPVPEYLERRQQFRRSEMRMRSKKNLLKKEASTPPVNGLSAPSFRSYSSDLDSRCPMGHHQEECKCDAVKRQLQEEIKLRPEAKSTSSPPVKPARSRSETRCGPANDEEERLLKSLYERRKLSVPTKRGMKVKESFIGIRTYNSTMIPKRITEMRKRRPKVATSCSTFYMDLDVSSDIAAIDHEGTKSAREGSSGGEKDKASSNGDSQTEQYQRSVSTDDACASVPVTSVDADSGEQMKDSEIISKLILDAGQFSKVLSKPLTKKKSFDASSCARPPSLTPNADKKPELPSTEPPCEDDDTRLASDGDKTPHSVEEQPPLTTQPESDDAEPIYESLLRNVHVPYKYAPASLTRHSLPCAKSGSTCTSPSKVNGTVNGASQNAGENVPARRSRPESDYVTLAYSELGLLQGIASEEGRGLLGKSNNSHKTPQLFRNSDTNISYHRDIAVARDSDEDDKSTSPLHLTTSPTEEGGEPKDGAPASLKQSFLERQGSLSMKKTTQKSILQRFISLHASSSSMSGTLGSEGNLLMHPLQRKLSEPNGSTGHIYKQGSMDLGSRIAHLDYADPKTLFLATSPTPSSTTNVSIGTNQNVLINRVSMQSMALTTSLLNDQQRDSVLASSSSSDSMCEEAKTCTSEGLQGGHFDDDENCCFYERTVEECLEHDFRDSAVYSGDDNDRLRGVSGADLVQHLYEPLTPVPGSRTNDLKVSTYGSNGECQRNTCAPPPVPAKPAHLGRVKRQTAVGVVPRSVETKPANSRGWVLQQVRRFQ